MYYNLVAYLLYAVISYFITVRVGWIFYHNGYHFIRAELIDEDITQSANRLLLVCYYLTNLGFITLLIWQWEKLESWAQMVGSLGEKTGFVLLSLATLHYLNMLVIYLISKRKNLTGSA
jgi:hypothetical protein